MMWFDLSLLKIKYKRKQFRLKNRYEIHKI